jgi:hypothetical protein
MYHVYVKIGRESNSLSQSQWKFAGTPPSLPMVRGHQGKPYACTQANYGLSIFSPVIITIAAITWCIIFKLQTSHNILTHP